MAHVPSPHPPVAGSEQAIMRAWERFLSGDGMPRDAVRRMVEDSWRRCLDQGVNPIRRAAPLAVDEAGLDTLQLRHGDLIEAARPVMAQAREFLSESGTMMILTDPHAVILSIEGDPQAKDNGQGVQLVPGALWNEQVSGTNAIGTALVSGNPVQICAAEHFCEGIKTWTCSASIIRDPFDGSIQGVLDISGLSGSHNTHCLALAVTGAGRIETRLAAQDMERRSRLLSVTQSRAQRWGNSGLVIFDRRGRLVQANDSAGLFLQNLGLDLAVCNDLRLTGHDPGPKNLPDWIQPDWIEPVMDREERLGTILALPLSRHWRRPSVAAHSPQTSSSEPPSLARIIGGSAAIRDAKARVRQLATPQVSVLLLGPTGAGKEVFARALHECSPNAAGPFVPLNCGSMTRELLTSELFGYVEGAFTGARRGGMVGKFEAADGGTLFLDEIGEMPLDLQTHLLRVLEEGEVYRLGENRPRKVRVRILAATNRDLRAEVSSGNFRMDLYYRLAVTTLRLPGLADRREDIPELIGHFLDLTAKRHGVAVKPLTADALVALKAYDWPGNVRELRNVIEGMLLLSLGPNLTKADLPPEITLPTAPTRITAREPDRTAGRLVDSERAALLAAIAADHGNLTRAALRLGIAKSTLYEKMKRLGIDRETIITSPD